MQHHGYQQPATNDYHQYYGQAAWENHHNPPVAARNESLGATTPYSGSGQGAYGSNPHGTQWLNTNSNVGPPVGAWGTHNWNPSEWHRGDTSIPVQYPNQLNHIRYNNSLRSNGTSHRGAAVPGMMQNEHGANYQRTLQYVQQCQTNWNTTIDKNRQDI